jgi:hypothetical protein
LSILAQLPAMAKHIFAITQFNKHKHMKIVVLAVLASAILMLTAARPYQRSDDTEKMKTALLNFFNGIETQDFEKLKAATTGDFVLYEDGRAWNIDSVFMNIKRHMPFKVKYQLSNIKIYADRQSGDASYSNHADFVFTEENENLDWVEGATFRKINGVWKINFLQITIKK